MQNMIEMKKDEILKKYVIDSLTWDSRVDASDVKVEVEDGKVTLTGTVPTYATSEAAMIDAWKPKGVVKVDNQLRVYYPSKLKMPTDSEITKRIESKLSWDPNINEKDIKVSTKKGTITMEGFVDSYWKKVKIERTAADTAGVLAIENTVAVVPSKSIVDEVIAKDIISAFDRDSAIDAEKIGVKVNDGKVSLTGSVDTWHEYKAAMDCVINTLGVKSIDDGIIIE